MEPQNMLAAWAKPGQSLLVMRLETGLAWTAHRIHSRVSAKWDFDLCIPLACGQESFFFDICDCDLGMRSLRWCPDCFRCGPIDTSGWRPLDEYVPCNTVRVLMADGSIIENAHWACGGGDDRPLFEGWFIPSGKRGYRGIDNPIRWK